MSSTRLPKSLQAHPHSPRLSRRKLYVGMLVASQWVAAGQLWASPEGGQVVGGEGIIQQTGVETIITQATERMAIDWRSFDVAANERVEFIQPSSSSIALNRVLSNRGSEILGRIDANGQVILVNANGVVFGKDAVVNVGGMIASGLNINPTSFINGDFTLNNVEGAEGKVINYGIINAATGGSVTLVGEQVQNDGLISAQLGAVNLVAGNAAVLTFDPSGMVGIRVTEAVVQDELGVDAAVINNGSINAAGGRVLLSASVSEDVFSSAVNNGGMSKTTSVAVHDDGSFTLGGGADVINTGDISTSVTEGNAGQVVMLGENITHSGSVTANTHSGMAGSVELHSADTTLLTENSAISAQASAQGEGGDVKVLGNKVGLFDHAEVNASGANGGGQVLIGGDKTGDNKNIRNADFIYLGEDTNVKTDALIDGNGGKLITFASDTARIYGNLYSRGGSEGGNGGFIETSGLKGFEILNTPDMGAEHGTGGLWLIDPYDINITSDFNTTPGVSNTSPFTSLAGNINLRVERIITGLGVGNVIVQTGDSGLEAGKITLSTSLSYTGNSERTLTFLAGNGIEINGDVASSNGLLNLDFRANNDGIGSGDFVIAAGRSISTNGGEVKITGVNFDAYTNRDNFGTINTYGQFGGGDIIIDVTGNVDLGATRFDYNYESADGNTAALARVGSLTIKAGGDVTLNEVRGRLNSTSTGAEVFSYYALNFNDTGRRKGNGEAGYSGNVLDAFLDVEAGGNINVRGKIIDSWGDARDSLNVTLTAPSGDINIEKDIYTAGGNFTATANNVYSQNALINTDKSNDNNNYRTSPSALISVDGNWSYGGNITINATTEANLGSLVTDAAATAGNRTGNLLIQGVNRTNGISTDNVQVAQTRVWNVAGTTTFNTGNGGNITLDNAGNIFTGSLFFTSAGNVQLTDSTAVGFGASNITGSLTLTSGGNITQTGNLVVGGATNLTIATGAAPANKSINLSTHANDFSGLVNVENISNLSLSDINNLRLGEVNLVAGAAGSQGNINVTATSNNSFITLEGNLNSSNGTTKNITLNGNVQLAANRTLNAGTGNIAFNGTINSDDADRKNLELTGRDITLTGAVGNLQALGDVALNSSGLVTVSAPAIDATSFSVTGADTDNDSFVLTNGRSNWRITGANSGTVQKLDESNASVSPLISFSGFQNITGGASVDTFNIDVADLDVVVNGGAGDDVFNINLATTKAFLNGDAGADTFNVMTTGSVTATLTGGDDDDTIVAANNQPNTWLLGTDERLNDTLGFSGIENITGGDDVDTFTFAGARNSVGVIDAKGGEDIVNVEDSATIDYAAPIFSFFGIRNAEVLNSLSGGTLTVASAVSDTINWLFDQTGSSTSQGDLESNKVKFTGFTSYTGGAGADVFVIKDNVTFTGLVDGGGNVNDSFSISGNTNPYTLVIADAFSSGSSVTLKGFESIIGNGHEDTLLAVNSEATNTWSITGVNQGTINPSTAGATTFSQIRNLVGGAGSDNFIFQLPGEITGSINGGSGDGVNSITARNENTTWSITGENSGSLSLTDAPNTNYLIEFSFIQNLIGSAANDTFSFADGAKVSSADGRGGNDTADLSNISADITVTIGADSEYGFTNVERIVANAAMNFTLAATDNANSWKFSNGVSELSYVGNDGIAANIQFVDFKNVQGGAGIDEFTFDTNFTGTVEGLGGDDIFNIRTALTGTLLGGAGADTFVFFNGGSVASADAGTDAGTDTSKDAIDLSNLSDQVVTINGSTLFNVAKIERVVGSANPDRNFTLTTSSAANTWRIFDVDGDAGLLADGINDGSVAGIEFINFRTLRGGSGVDEFTFDTNFTGTVEGLGGDDIFNIRTALTGTLLGGAGADTFVFFNGGSVASADAGTDAGTDTSKDVVDLSNLSTDQTISIEGSTLFNVANIERIVGSATRNFTLTTSFAANTWRIFDVDGTGTLADGINDGSVAGIEFINFSRLRGGSGVDEFTFDTNFTGTVEGLGGDDIFNIRTALTGTLLGGAGADTFVFFNGGSVASANAGGDASKDVVDLSNLSTDQVVTINGSTLFNVTNIERVVGSATRNFTLTTSSAANTWRIFDVDGVGSLADGINDGSVAGIEFINFSRLRGGSGVDEFTFDTDFTGTVEGLDGDDIFNIRTALTGTLLGGDGADSFVFFDGGSVASANAGSDASKDVVDLSNLLTDPTTVTINGSTLFNVTNIERVVADADKNFTLTTSSAANTWRIFDVDGVGTLADGINDGSVAGIEFINFRRLQGGSGVDEFTFDTNFTGTVEGLGGDDIFTIRTALTGTLLGGAGADTFVFFDGGSVASADAGTDASKDVVDLSNLTTGPTTVTVDGSTLYNVANIERVIANETRNFTLTTSSAANTWRIFDVDGIGTLADGINDGSVAGIEFINFRTLRGGSGVDEFTFDTNFTGTVEGLGGDDIFNIRTALTGTLLGGAGADTFVFFNGGSVASANAGGDASKDVVDLSNLSTDQVVTINGSTLFNVTNIERVVGSATRNFTLTTSSAANTWRIFDVDGDAGLLADGINDGSVAGIEFINFRTLRGGTGVDTFTFDTNFTDTVEGLGGDDIFTIRTALTGTLLGGDGADTFVFFDGGSVASANAGSDASKDVVDLSNLLTDPTTVTINGSTLFNVANIERVIANNNRDFTLSSLAAGPTAWTIQDFDGTGSLADGMNDGTVGNVEFINFTNLVGGSGEDTFTFVGTRGVIQSIDGGGGANTLIGRNAANIWLVDGENRGNVSIEANSYVGSFSRIQNLTGGTGNDDFYINGAIGDVLGNDGNDRFFFNSNSNVGSAARIDGGDGNDQLFGRETLNTWTITDTNSGTLGVTGTTGTSVDVYASFSGIETLNGGEAADEFFINAAITGGISAGNGNNIFRINTNVVNLLGGDNDDQFIFGASGSAQSVNGGAGFNTLRGRDAATTWNITGEDAGNLVATQGNATYVNNFYNIQSLQGGNNVDIFNINARVRQIYANGGNDEFVFSSNNNAGIAEFIDGGVGASAIRGRNQTNTWTMTGSNSGSVAVTNSAPYVTSFVNIKTLIGGSLADTLAATNQENSWTISGSDAGTLYAAATPLQSILFEGIENLLGGQGADLFTFGENGYVRGLIDGGTSASRDTVKDTLNLSARTSNVTVRLGNRNPSDLNVNNSNLNVNNVEEILASTTNWDNHVIIGASDVAYRWRINGVNTGIIETLTDPLMETSVQFFNFGDIRGGDNSDRFDVQGTITKNIDGGGGENLVDYSQRRENFVIDLGGSGGLGITGISRVQGVVGNSASGTGFTSTIRVSSSESTWEIGADDPRFGDGVNDGSVTFNNNKVRFENFTHLIGGDGRDTFNYLANGGWIGNINGGGGTNSINASASTRDQQFVVGESSLSAATRLINIGELSGNVNTNSRLVSLQANTWQIDNQGGTLNNSLKFNNIAHLQGGDLTDTFTIARLTGLKSVDAGGGSDTVNLTGVNNAIQVALDADTDADIRVLNAEFINANTNFANTLKGEQSGGNQWRIDGSNRGILNQKITFTGFANLVGSSFADSVVFTNSNAALGGHLDLGDGADVLDLSAAGRDTAIQLNASKVAVAAGILSVSNIETVVGSTSHSTRLIGDNFANTWLLDDVNAGRVSATEMGSVKFSNVNNLSGGALDDLFVFEALGNVTGLVDGGGHATRDTLDLSLSNNSNVNIAGSGQTSGYINIERFIGNNTNSTFTAADTANRWELSGVDRGRLNGTIEFENFGILKGGSGQDEFDIRNATITGAIDSGDGDDSFVIQASAIAGKIMAGAGNDRFEFNLVSGAEGIADVDGGSGENRLTVRSVDAGYSASHQSGRLEYVSAANNTQSILYSNIDNIFDNVVANSLTIFGTLAPDVFRLQTARYSTDNRTMVNYTNKSNLIINGSADDQAIVEGVVGVESTVTFNNLQIIAENTGRIQARSLELVNTGAVGSAASRLNTTVADISLSNTTGNIFIEEFDGLLLKNFSISNSDMIDIKAGGSLSASGALAYSGNLNLESVRGDINLGSTNSLSGLLNLRAAGNITLGNLQTLSLGDVVAQNATFSAGTSIRGAGVFSVAGLASLDATNDIQLLNTNNDINQLNVSRAGNLDIVDKNGFTTTGLNITNDVRLGSSGNIIINTSCTTDCANSVGINARNINIASDAGVTVAKNIVATENVNIRARDMTINDSITAKQFTLNADGKIVLNESGNLVGNAGTGIDITAGTLEQSSAITSGGMVRINTSGNVTMSERASVESLNSDVWLSGNNLQLGLLNASAGTVTTKAGAGITDGNASAANIIATRWQANAVSGIGTGFGTGGDAIETSVGVLSALNEGRLNSTINIANTNTLTIEQLRNNGNIAVSITKGDLVLDNSNNEKFNLADPDALTQGGVINAGLTGQLLLNMGGGMVRAENKANKQNPDIIADVGTFSFQSSFDFGERNRKIVMHIPSTYNQNARLSFVAWHLTKPATINDLSKVPSDSLISGRDQLIQIEGLSEIDPAIFTSLRNYVHDEVAILLPLDQRFDEDEETF